MRYAAASDISIESQTVVAGSGFDSDTAQETQAVGSVRACGNGCSLSVVEARPYAG